MQVDPMEEWRRLTQLYAEMGDEELEDLACSFSDLTETARPILRDEMRKRGLGDPQAPVPIAGSADRHIRSRWEPPAGASAVRSARSSADGGIESGDEGAHEFTWKTLLCECETSAQAWQIGEMLRRAEIDSWIDTRKSFLLDPTLALLNPQVLVAADELERAREIVRQPIPQDIVELSKVKQPEYEPPVCPSCGAADPVLEGVDPANAWRCDSCGREWTDAAAADGQAEGAASRGGKRP